MNKRTRAPTHPGGILRRQYLEPLNLTVSDLAKALALSRKTVSKLANERGTVTPDIALRLSVALNTSPQLWLNLQQSYDLWHTARDLKDWKRAHRIAA